MPIPSRATLKALFQNGDRPDEDDFATLIDAIFDSIQVASNDAAAAVVTADAASALVTARAPRAYVHFKYTTSGTDRWTVDNSVGCTIVLSSTRSHTATITFDDPPGDTKYIIMMNGNEGGGSEPAIVSKGVSVLVLTLDTTTPADGDTRDLVVFR